MTVDFLDHQSGEGALYLAGGKCWRGAGQGRGGKLNVSTPHRVDVVKLQYSVITLFPPTS